VTIVRPTRHSPLSLSLSLAHLLLPHKTSKVVGERRGRDRVRERERERALPTAPINYPQQQPPAWGDLGGEGKTCASPVSRPSPTSLGARLLCSSATESRRSLPPLFGGGLRLVIAGGRAGPRWTHLGDRSCGRRAAPPLPRRRSSAGGGRDERGGRAAAEGRESRNSAPAFDSFQAGR
jgi:hypothetical protein